MIVYPNAKINLGLNVLRKRIDNFHDISSVFYPLHVCFDVLEIIEADQFVFNITGIDISDEDNLCIRAWKTLKEDFNIGNVHMHLHKQIPIGSGLGGGSSDASFTLMALNQIFDLQLSNIELERYAMKIGSDCPFFIHNNPKLVEGKGERMKNIDVDLSDYEIRLIDPRIHISSNEAYSKITPIETSDSIEELIKLPVTDWKGKLKNDFESVAFELYPQLKDLKDQLYSDGAIYASMSGSGSVIFGIF